MRVGTAFAEEEGWYGWQTAIASGVSIATLTAGAAISERTLSLSWAGLAMGAVAPAIVHMAHGNFARGAGSVAVEVFVPIVFAFVGGLVGSEIPGCSWGWFEARR